MIHSNNCSRDLSQHRISGAFGGASELALEFVVGG